MSLGGWSNGHARLKRGKIGGFDASSGRAFTAVWTRVHLRRRNSHRSESGISGERRGASMAKIKGTVGACSCALAVAAFANPSRADSSWASRVGLVGDDDVTSWCTTGVVHTAQGDKVTGRFQRIDSNGNTILDPAVLPVAVQVHAKCTSGANTSNLLSDPSLDSNLDKVEKTCPNNGTASFVRCRIVTPGSFRYVYKGTDCGNGIAAQSPVTSVSLRGQLTGGFYELQALPPLAHPPGFPLFNDTCASNALNLCTSKGFVGGTDLGFMFLGGGKLNIGFGDTWENDTMLPGANGLRGSVLFTSTDFNALDANGLRFGSFERSTATSTVAQEVIPSLHDGNPEVSAIPFAGFAIRENNTYYRFLWFASIATWEEGQHLNNFATLAYSPSAQPSDVGQTWIRGDWYAPTDGPPRWEPDSNFGGGAIWHNRETGWIYFFGVTPYEQSPIRLAAVRANVASILDATQYWYWGGPTRGWERDANRDLQESKRAFYPDSADIVPASANARPEFSVTFDSYVNRWIMLLSTNTVPGQTPVTQLWQSPAPQSPDGTVTIEGTWSKVTQNALPTAATFPGLYGAYTNEHIMGGGGRDVPFVLSQWSFFTQPYNVALWRASLNRATISGCPIPQ